MNYGYGDEQENFGMGDNFFSDLVNKANTGLTKVLTKSSKVSNAILSADARLKALKAKVAPLIRRKPATTPSTFKPAGPSDKPPVSMQNDITTGTLPAVVAPKRSVQESLVKYAPYIAAIAGGILLINMMTPKFQPNPRRRSRR